MIPFLIRPHRGSLADAMYLCVAVKTFEDVRKFLEHHRVSRDEDLRWNLYCDEPDTRISGWQETYIISQKAGVLGFANFSLWELKK